MKYLFSLLLIPLFIFPFDAYKVDEIQVVYQYSDQPYDYVSMIVEKGYVNSTDFNQLNSIVNYVKGDSIDAYIKCYPDYTVMEFYSKSPGSVNVLLKIRRALNEKPMQSTEPAYDLLDIAILERWGYSIREKENPKSLTLGGGISASKTSIFIKTMRSREEVDGIIKAMNLNPSLSESSFVGKPLLGEYWLGDIPADIYFYDFRGLKDFDLSMYLLLLYAMNAESKRADIRSVGKDFFIVSAANIDKAGREETFEQAKKMLIADIEISESNISELVYKMNFIFHENPRFKFIGVKNKIERAIYKDYTGFISSLKHALVFRRGYPELSEVGYEAKKLKNNITLLYRNKTESGTEIAVAFKNVIQTEREWSKQFASDMIFADLESRFRSWKSEISLPRSNLRIFSFKSSESSSIFSLTEFISQLVKLDMENIRMKSRAEEIMNTWKIINETRGLQTEIDSSFILLSDGEYRMAAGKIFSGANIIISVESALPMEKFADFLENIPLQKGVETLSIEPKSAEDVYIDYAFNLLNRYLTEDLRVIHVGDVFPQPLKYPSRYYDLAKRNKINILALLSYILYSDANKLILHFK
ncbi:MAG: hypothetical protein AB7T10_06540 [bacterium]